MNPSKKVKGFTSFLSRFPLTTLPISINQDLLIEYSRTNKPLSEDLVFRFILPENEAIDEYTEFVPCFRLPETKKIHALVYWKGSLMNYEFGLLTFDLSGEFIDRMVIAGTIQEDKTLVSKVAHLKDNQHIILETGIIDPKAGKLVPKSLQIAGKIHLDLNNGKINLDS